MVPSSLSGSVSHLIIVFDGMWRPARALRAGKPIGDDSQGFVKPYPPRVAYELFPMKPAVDNLHFLVRQVDLPAQMRR